MPDLKAKMHQNKFWLGLCPRPCWGAYSTPPDTLTGFNGPTSKGRGEGRGEEGTGKEGRGGNRGASALCWNGPPE